ENDMQEWMTLLEKRLGDRNIVDIVLDRLDLANIGMHKRQGSYSSLRSFYSKNSSFCSSGGSTTTNSNLSSRRPSLDSLSLDTPPLDSRKSSMDSFRGNQNTISHNTIVNNNNSDSFPYQSISRPETPSNLVALFGIGQPILRKPASHGCLQDKHIINSINNSSANNSNIDNTINDVVYFLGNDDNNNVDLNDDEDSLITPLANVFPSLITFRVVETVEAVGVFEEEEGIDFDADDGGENDNNDDFDKNNFKGSYDVDDSRTTIAESADYSVKVSYVELYIERSIV
ncbi:385_t:CDS:2, partial [Entrophospora sp. SA101]